MCSNDKAAKITNVFNFERVKKNISGYKVFDRQVVLCGCLLWLLFSGLQSGFAQTVPDGKFSVSYENGVIKERGTYRNGQKDQLWMFYNPNGSLDRKEKWKNGRLKWQIFYSKGKIIKTINEKGEVKNRSRCGC